MTMHPLEIEKVILDLETELKALGMEVQGIETCQDPFLRLRVHLPGKERRDIRFLGRETVWYVRDPSTHRPYTFTSKEAVIGYLQTF